MTESTPLSAVLERLTRDPSWRNVTARHSTPPRKGRYAGLPEDIHGDLKDALSRRGIDRLYSHQRRVWDLVRQGSDVVVATPTASGKSLAFHLPVLDSLARDPSATALYLYPTKALARDQFEDLLSLSGSGKKLGGVYDGDTPASARRRLRSAARLIISNPDMLHRALLPHHPAWSRFFSGLKYVVIDEVHQYRGIFGSHAANVFRRLHRVCRFWGAEPRVIASSATIANPGELTGILTGRNAVVVDVDGAPACRKDFLFYNPPLVDRDRGIRAGNWWETVRIAVPFLAAGHKAIVFARSRRETEVILTYLKEALRKEGLPETWARGYRGGYLPAERREIEEGLRRGGIRAVVSTTALELGIDIGDLDVAVISGYPGSVSSTYQQAGRAGRRSGDAAAFLVAENSPLDQFIVSHPDYFFGQPPESAALNPDNPHVLASHLACACFELPLGEEEPFGSGETSSLLDDLESSGRLHRSGESWHWVGQTYPAAEVSLRSAAAEACAIRDAASGEEIGMVDTAGAPLLVHEEAVYLHGGETFVIEELDMTEKRALARKAEVDYFTEPLIKVALETVGREEGVRRGEVSLGHGGVDIITRVTGYRRLRLFTHEQLGREELDLPESRMSTTSCWFALSREGASRQELAVLQGTGYLLSRVAPLYVLCDPRDIRSYHLGGGDDGNRLTLHLYDNYPGGAGYSVRIFENFPRLVSAAHEVAKTCPCRRGCPSCLGPEMAVVKGGKPAAREFLSWLCTQFEGDGG
jgi:DEAD/DEAH box helicase domain-containing protein